MGYDRVGPRRIAIRGFRIVPKRLTVQRLRSKYAFCCNLFNRLRLSCAHALSSLRRGLAGSDRRGVYGQGYYVYDRNDIVACRLVECRLECRLGSLGRSNSFYAEAIDDCLEFIKRSSVSVDD